MMKLAKQATASVDNATLQRKTGKRPGKDMWMEGFRYSWRNMAVSEQVILTPITALWTQHTGQPTRLTMLSSAHSHHCTVDTSHWTTNQANYAVFCSLPSLHCGHITLDNQPG